MCSYLKRFVAFLIVTVVLFTSCNKPAEVVDDFSSDITDSNEITQSDSPNTARDTLVVGISDYNYIFNPFFALHDNDVMVADLTSVKLLAFDRNGELVENAIEGKTDYYNGKEYKYNGISNVEIETQTSGESILKIKLREDVRFSNGEILDIDDVIFSMYVLSDNKYRGPSQFATLPICGMNEYRDEESDSISGIKRTGDFSLEITMYEYDRNLLAKLNIYVAPLHYYGAIDKYDYNNNMFGFDKGDLSAIEEKSVRSVGAGPYVLKTVSKELITLARNDNYYKGAPVIENIRIEKFNDEQLIDNLSNNKIDVALVNYNERNVEEICSINGGNINGKIISTDIIEKSGYGYIGISADLVKINEDKASVESKNLRKAFALLFIAYNENYNSDKRIKSFLTDINGNDICEEIGENDKHNAALKAAIEYFIAAGFTFDSNIGKFILAPYGASLEYDLYFCGEGIGNHPAYQMLSSVKNALDTIGITLKIHDVADEKQFVKDVTNSNYSFWVAAWEDSSIDIYHSSGINGVNGYFKYNCFGIDDKTLDSLIEKSQLRLDSDSYSSLLESCYEIVGDWCVEVPIYQYKEMVIVNSQAIDSEIFGKDYNANCNWIDDIYKLQISPGY